MAPISLGNSHAQFDDGEIPILGQIGGPGRPPGDRHIIRLVEQLRRSLLSPPSSAERLHALFLDGKQMLLGEKRVADGSVSGLDLRMRDLFSKALSLGARGIILAHNHPSGICRPSQRDFEATHCVANVARALEIELLDHLIFTHSAVYSMRARGEL